MELPAENREAGCRERVVKAGYVVVIRGSFFINSDLLIIKAEDKFVRAVNVNEFKLE